MATNALALKNRPDSGDGEELGEYLEIEGPHGPEVSDAPDGGWYVTLGDQKEEQKTDPEGGFYANLADVLPSHCLSSICSELIRCIAEDREGRKDRDKQYEEGIRRTGLGKDAPGGADFDGASRVVHPMLTEACIDYEARVMKEMWPPSGPVKARILGKVTAEKAARAERKVDYLNFQLTTEMKEARDVFESMWTQLPLGGSQFIKLWWDHRLHRAKCEFVPVDKVLLPASAANFESATRRSYVETITAVDYRHRVDQGLYRKLPSSSPPAQTPERSSTEKANEKVEGVKKDAGLNIDGEREICETMYFIDVTDEMASALHHEKAGELYPYLVTIDVQNQQVLAIYRDWEEDDETRQPIEHLFEFKFIPWRGAYAIGLPHIAGGLSGAATGALRALLDSAQIANMQGGFILKGSGASGQNANPTMGTLQEISTGIEAVDIRKTIMMFNTKEPSNVLFQLLGFVAEAGKGVIRTTLEATAIDTNANTPVGTQMSRVEEALVVFSELHARAHAAFDRFLSGLHRLNRLYLPDRISIDALGKELFIRRRDFEGPPDIQPVSDPTIYSDQQRWAQLAEMERAAVTFPGLYKMRAIQERKMKLLKVPNPEELLIDAPQPHELNAVNENLAMALGRPVVVFPEQGHLGHLQTHLDFAKSPALGLNPILAPKFLPAALQHCAEHMVYEYVRLMDAIVTKAAGRKASELMSRDDEVKRMFDQLLAMASQRVIPEADKQFAGAVQVLQQGMAMLKSLMPPPPMDPAAAAVAAAQAETARKGKADDANAQVKIATVTAGRQTDSERNAIEAERNRILSDKAQTDAETKITTTEMDNETARDIASERVAMGQKPNMSNGESMRGR